MAAAFARRSGRPGLKALVPAGFAIAAAGEALLLAHAPAAYAVDRAQPLAVVTYWQQYGAWMCAVLLAGMAVSACGYVWWLRCLRGANAQRNIIIACLAACALALAVPAVFSSDVYAYAGYGAMLAHGMNPYAHARIALRDPLLDAVQWQWGNPPPVCVYGPGFLLIARAAVLLQAWG
ncbi:MAG: hypothetical protein ABR508_11925, partial [Candidatus Baltobacteraceae bacterium]